MSSKQLFIKLFLGGTPIPEAARQAGYPRSSAYRLGEQLIRKGVPKPERGSPPANPAPILYVPPTTEQPPWATGPAHPEQRSGQTSPASPAELLPLDGPGAFRVGVESLRAALNAPGATPATIVRAATALAELGRKAPPPEEKPPELEIDYSLFSEGELDWLDVVEARIRKEPVDMARMPYILPKEPSRWGLDTEDAATLERLLQKASEHCSAEALGRIQ